ncbi:heparin lyase I family protein [Amycolatopsis echigonensis]|uniref:Heparin lyase I family protein n=1 Tax=Amycolatopsis echigonensis TaxID=2576905 RepID=A0A2N3W9Z3_9PSEU|nr:MULTISPECIES: heparin lyase I family protein [Amycolatopsis]MBB2503014.1 heparin lyase I family protein [Amycolatopsis echigonensis]PKV90694.1 polysaccharide lyase-like protein [Amycolatopsis niigatensis]
MRKVFACSAAAVASTLVVAAIAAAPVGAAPAPAPRSVTWSADPAAGVGAFTSIQCADGHFKTAKDAAKGKVWVAEQLANEERCEAVGPDLSAGKTFYLGWSSKYRITDSTSRYVFQLKCSPSTGTANHPIVLEVIGGKLRLEDWTTDHTSVTLWDTPISNDQWHDIAFRISTDRTKGTIQFWFDGKRQTFSDGSTTYTGTTIDGTRNYLKWGVYHQADQTATQWLSKIRMGGSLADVTG